MDQMVAKAIERCMDLDLFHRMIPHPCCETADGEQPMQPESSSGNGFNSTSRLPFANTHAHAYTMQSLRRAELHPERPARVIHSLGSQSSHKQSVRNSCAQIKLRCKLQIRFNLTIFGTNLC